MKRPSFGVRRDRRGSRSRAQVAVYTAIASGVDELEQPKIINDSVRYVCFTDAPVCNPGIWEIRPIRRLFLHPRKAAKRYKVLAHRFFPDADVSLYVDGTFCQINIDPVEAIRRWLTREDIALFRHPERNCIYEEAEACVRMKKDDPHVIRAQIAAYRKSGYPEQAGLVAGGVILRRHNDDIARLNEAWWKEIVTFSIRDQLSFNYVLAQSGLRCGTIPGGCWDNPYFPYTPHKVDMPQLKPPPTERQVAGLSPIKVLNTGRELAAIEGAQQVTLEIPRAKDGILVRSLGNDPILILPAIECPHDRTLFIQVEIVASDATLLQLFYLTHDSPSYSEDNSVSSAIKPGFNRVSLHLPATGDMLNGALRLDPANRPGEFTILRVSFCSA